jgi:hypothetical protein
METRISHFPCECGGVDHVHVMNLPDNQVLLMCFDCGERKLGMKTKKRLQQEELNEDRTIRSVSNRKSA